MKEHINTPGDKTAKTETPQDKPPCFFKKLQRTKKKKKKMHENLHMKHLENLPISGNQGIYYGLHKL